MRHIIFEEASNYPIALLLKASAFNKTAIKQNYMDTLQSEGISPSTVIAFDLQYNEHGKAPAGFIKEYLDPVLKALESLGTKFLYVADTNYFKVLTKQTKSEVHLGYVLPCTIKGYEHMQVVYGISHQVLIFNPEMKNQLKLSVDTLASAYKGTYTPLGQGIIHSATYPETLKELQEALDSLHQYPRLTADIEAFSLRFWEAGIATCAFAWDEHNGMAFACDYSYADDEDHGVFIPDREVRQMLKQFLLDYKGTLIWHNSGYDVKVIIYTLWMEHPQDWKGLQEGLHHMCKNWHDTMIIAYLATNTTAGNVLGLKPLAHEFAGNWAVEEIKDVGKIPLRKLREYNLIDALSTFYVFNKYYNIMVEDNQKDFYYSMALPSQKVLIQIELTGMPMSFQKIQEVEAILQTMKDKACAVIESHQLIKDINFTLQNDAMEAANAKLKTKQHPLSKFADVVFNPGSSKNMQKLLYSVMKLPVIDYTDTKQPAVGADTLEKLVHHCTDVTHKELLKSFVDYAKVEKILSTFIAAMKRGFVKADGVMYLHGSFIFGGTVSGRLSSNSPNLQNLPSNSSLAKLIKMCFMPAMGWLFCGADFSSLEDKINSLLTKDPNKIKVYTDHYDGHALRAYAYFGDQMPDIQNTVESINSIADKKHPHYYLRQDSKSPTFALTYQGTWRTMVKNLGWPEDKAKKVEANYNTLYQVSIQWVKDKIQGACEKGYAEVAFGLRIRTPLLGQSVLGGGAIREAEAEARTLGNAISGQSYGLLNNRAINAFMAKVWDSPFKYDILPVALIHDAIYLMVKDDVEVVAYVNEHLIKEMEWQELPEIQHPEVKLGAELDIFWPSWANPITVPNGLSKKQISDLCAEAKRKYAEK
jgi:DNA polymerase-1